MNDGEGGYTILGMPFKINPDIKPVIMEFGSLKHLVPAKVTKTAGGLFLIETPPEPVVHPQPKGDVGIVCTICGAIDIHHPPFWMGRHFNDSGWYRHTWTCGHKDIRCGKPECGDGGCPVCGCDAEYT